MRPVGAPVPPLIGWFRLAAAVGPAAPLWSPPPPDVPRKPSTEPPMSTLVRARVRTAGTLLALALAAPACGTLGGGAGTELKPALTAGRPAGSVTVATGSDPGQLVQGLQDAIVAGGGTVAAVVDHAATAREAGVQIPPNTVVIGGPAAADLALVSLVQKAGVNLPPPYQVRQDTSGATVLTFDSPEYLAAISNVSDPAARVPMRTASDAIIGKAAPAGADAEPAPLIGVTPVDYVLTVFGSRDIAGTIGLLERAAGRTGNKFVATVEFIPEAPRARGAAPTPPLPVSVVLVSRPAAEAPLLAAAPSIGLDLPLRFSIWIDEQNRTIIGYPDIRRIAVRHGIPADDPNVVALAAEADKLGQQAAGNIQ
jgi:uncharacterized protein (DUF302 family)